MAFGLLMRDNTPVDAPFRRSGRTAEESVRLGYVPGGPYYPQRAMGYVPGGPYYPQQRARAYGIPPGVAARVPQYNDLTDVPGVPYGYVPGGPYYPAIRARRFGAVDVAEIPGVPGGFGDEPAPSLNPTALGPVYDPTLLAQTNSGSTWDWQAAANATGQLATSLVNAFTNTAGQQSCPPGYALVAGGRCAPLQSSSSSMGMLALGALAVGALLFLKK